MKKFVFTLQALLNVKGSLEKQKKAELSEQNAVIKRLEDELEALYKRLEATVSEYNRKMQQGGMSPGDTAAYGSGFRAMYDKIREQVKRIQRAEAVKEKLQNELTELMGERKMLENLKEKQYFEYLEEVKRDDAKMIDDYLSTKLSGEG